MIRETIKKAKFELLDTHSNHKWFFDIDFMGPQIKIFKNGLPKTTLNSIELPLSNDYLMSLTKGL